MDFSDLLIKRGLDPKEVVVMRHQPTELALRRQLRWLAAEDEEALIAYQSSHSPRAEAALRRARFIASFVADGASRALFLGLYEITRTELVPYNRWLENDAIRNLVGLGSDIGERDEVIWFHQSRASFYDEWKGRLVIAWPPPERAWYRWADRNPFTIIAIHEDDELVERLSSWDRLVFTWQELSRLPRRYRQIIQGLRGIYLIRDKSDSKCYVGSAYGADNILGRWQNYAKTGHGDNARLRSRDPQNFEFSILEVVADNLAPNDVIEREISWKVRLGSRWPHGLNGN